MLAAESGSSGSGWDASTWVAVVAAVITAVGTAITLWALAAARSQAESAKSQAESARVQTEIAKDQTELQRQIARDAAQPYVWADFRPDTAQGTLVNLVVHNQGPTVAHDVRVVFNPPLQSIGMQPGYTLRPVYELLSAGLDSMPPGRELKWPFASGHKIDQTDPGVPTSYEVCITARGPHGPTEPLRYVLDVSEMAGARDENLGSLRSVAEAIDGLAKLIKPRQ